MLLYDPAGLGRLALTYQQRWVGGTQAEYALARRHHLHRNIAAKVIQSSLGASFGRACNPGRPRQSSRSCQVDARYGSEAEFG